MITKIDKDMRNVRKTIGYDHIGLSNIVISRVVQVTDNGNVELYTGHRDFCDLYLKSSCDVDDDSLEYKLEDITPYAIRKYDGISSKPMTVGYANLNNAVKWIKRNCSNAGDTVTINRNYRIDGYVNGNGGLYKFRIEYIDSLDY